MRVFRVVKNDELRFAADDYTVTARGKVSLDAVVDLRARFVASNSLTKSLVREVKGLDYLRASAGLIAIPFRLEGPVDALRVELDMRHLAKKVAPALIGDWLGKFSAKRRSSKSGSGAGAKR